MANDILGRLAELEKSVAENNKKYERSVATVLEIVSAIIKTSGEGFDKKVETTINEARQAAAVERAAEEKKMLESLVEKGLFVKAETVAESGTVLVGKEIDKNGNLLGGGRVQVTVEQLSEDHRAKLLGKGVGFVLDTGDSNFEITELYQLNPTMPVIEPKPAPAVEPPADAK